MTRSPDPATPPSGPGSVPGPPRPSLPSRTSFWARAVHRPRNPPAALSRPGQLHHDTEAAADHVWQGPGGTRCVTARTPTRRLSARDATQAHFVSDVLRRVFALQFAAGVARPGIGAPASAEELADSAPCSTASSRRVPAPGGTRPAAGTTAQATEGQARWRTPAPLPNGRPRPRPGTRRRQPRRAALPGAGKGGHATTVNRLPETEHAPVRHPA